jgi:5-methylcytosine-specific restriction protein A
MERWTPEQLQASVDAYLDMRERVARGEKVNKAETFRDLANKYGKDDAAWTRRFGNISQVMEELGYRQIPGLRPLANVGTNVTKLLVGMIQARIGDAEAGLADAEVRASLVLAEQAVNASNGFSPEGAEDQRRRVLRSVVQRRGQPAFRKALIEVYGGRCAITGCAIVDLLEAAHVYPYKDGATNDVSNGLLLRADLHTLFDLRLISADPDTSRVVGCKSLQDSEYQIYIGKALAIRSAGAIALSVDALRWHRSRCEW